MINRSYKVDILAPLHTGDKVRYRLLEDITLLGYTAKAGFITDGATTPRCLWGFIPPVDAYFAAAVIHDYLLTELKFKRKKADDVFYQGLKFLKVNIFIRTLMYAGVRLNSIINHYGK